MEVRSTPELEKKLNELAAHEMLDRLYDDLKSGRVKPVDGEAFFESLRQREEDLLTPRTR